MLRSIVGKSLGGVVAAGVLGLCAVSAQAITPFEQDVNDAIDAGLQYARTQNWFSQVASGSNGPGNGLLLLALREQSGDEGYAGLDAADKTLARRAACILIDDGSFGICEVCGMLSDTLESVNGELLCWSCRDGNR